MYISDHLSRSPILNVQKDYDIFSVRNEGQLLKDIEEIDPKIYHDVTDKSLKKVAKATAEVRRELVGVPYPYRVIKLCKLHVGTLVLSTNFCFPSSLSYAKIRQ